MFKEKPKPLTIKAIVRQAVDSHALVAAAQTGALTTARI